METATKPLSLEQWGIGRPTLAVVTARQAALGTEALHGVLEFYRTGECMEQFPPLPPTETWLAIYRDHWRLHDFLVDGLWPSDNPACKTSLVFKLLTQQYRALCRMTLDQRKAALAEVPAAELVGAFQEGRQAAAEMNKEQVADIRRDIAGTESPDDATFRKLWPQPEFQFFIRAWMPCVMIYNDYPCNLMRKARHGDIDAMCDLLRLDKMVIAEPRIAREFACSQTTKRRARFKKLAKALASPSKSLSLRQTKSLMAGFISKIFASVGQPIAGPEIQSLFDAVHQDYGRGHVDPEIPTGESLAKGLQRQRKRWRILPDAPPKQPDKNRA